MAVKTYYDPTKSFDLSGTVLKQDTPFGEDRECPECKGWIRVAKTNYLGNPQVMEAITHARPCEMYRQWLRGEGVSEDRLHMRN